MKRKTFLQMSSALAAFPLLSPFASFGQSSKGRLKNWAENLEYSTSEVAYPKTVAEVQAAIRKVDKARVLGTRHCFNRIADSKYQLISSQGLNKILSLDPKARTVTVEAGIRYGELCPYLDEKGFALHNLASLPHISIAGSCATATHGSGVRNGNLATAIRDIELVTADGTVVTYTREKNPDKVQAAAVNLGALGMVTKLTLDIQPSFRMKQYVFERLPMTSLAKNFIPILSAGYSVSLFTDWTTDSINEVWIKTRAGEKFEAAGKSDFYGAMAAKKNLHPIATNASENCTDQMGVEGPWYERLPHFKMGFTPSNGRELQAEYFVPLTRGMEAIQAVAALGKQISPHLFISEIRTIAADQLWMSPHRGQDMMAIHFTWKQETEAVMRLLPVIEKELASFGAMPHWGKLFTIPASKLAASYEKINSFRNLARELDPKGKFRNEFLDATVFAS